MSWRTLNLTPFFETASDSATPIKELSAGDIEDILNQDDDDDKIELEPEKEVKKESERDDKKVKADKEDKESEDDKEDKEDDKELEDEEDELKLLEDDVEEPSEEQLSLTTPVSRREILKKYPTLFKDFPYLEKSYYREREFTQMFPEMSDAKEALESKDVLDKFESDLMDGNIEVMLTGLRNSNREGFNRLVDNYLDVLQKVDDRAYTHIVGNVIKETIIQMWETGKEDGKDELKDLAAKLNQFVFGSTKFKPITKLSKSRDDNDDRDEKYETRRQEELESRFNSARDDMDAKINKRVKNTIAAHIDPKNNMTDYIKRYAIQDAVDKFSELVNNDSRFRAVIDKLWERAIRDGFSSKSLEAITSAFSSRAGTLLPTVIKKARIEALKGMGVRKTKVKEDDEEDSPPDRKSRDSGPSKSRSKKDEIPEGMSTLDYLSMD